MRENRRLFLFATLALAAALALAACGGNDGSADGGDTSGGEPIKIGFAIGQSGVLEAFDGSALASAQLAIEDINAEGGVDGRDLKADVKDTKSDPAQAANAAIELLNAGAEVLVIPCDFDFGGATAAAEAEKQGVLAISSCGASARFGPQGVGDLTFTMATSGSGEGSAMGEWATGDPLNAKTAVTVRDTTFLYGEESVAGFEGQFVANGGEILSSETMKNDDQSFATQVSAIQEANPDVIYMSSYMPGEAGLIKQIRAAGIDTPILADEDVDGDYWKQGLSSSALSDIYFATYASIYGDDPDDKVNKLVARYTMKTGNPPDVAAGIMTGYSVVEAIAAAIEGAGGSTNGAKLASELETWVDKKFLVGPTTFTDQLHITPVREERIMQIQDGKTSYLETFRPADVTLPEGAGG